MQTVHRARELSIDRHRVMIRLATSREVVDLRHRVLRSGLPREAAIFDGDDLPTSRHFAAFLNESAVCCATFHISHWDGEPAWQLRGMATDESFRSKGIGGELLRFAERMLAEENGDVLLWCNARIGALRFYQANGWSIASAQFEIATAGPHYRMIKRLGETKQPLQPQAKASGSRAT